jgi:hypothetical protein
MKSFWLRTGQGTLLVAGLTLWAPLIRTSNAANAALLGWSETGFHETDGADVSIYSLLPPFSTLLAQLAVGGKLVTSSNAFSVTYEAVADPAGSLNSTSRNKGNFYQFAQALYGQSLALDQGLAGFAMPGPANQPQAMAFDPAQNCFIAQGIPLTPYDDQGQKNYFPMMRLVARDTNGTVVASAQVVLPVSDEMDCRSCHASGSQGAARPAAGWVWDCDPVKDYKLNILRYHDEARAGAPSYTDVLKQVGYNPDGLVATVLQDGQPVLCIRCHASNALPGSGAPGMRPFTRLMHTKHAQVMDPVLNVAMDDINQSAACLRCHAGPEARYLRGTHHNSINPDGTLAMACQNCHGNLTAVGSKNRNGYLDEPSCQNCHTGTATSNAGQLRYTSAFTSPGQPRTPLDQTFATQTNTPAAGFNLYRTSVGHGGLQCAACHGPTHGEWASTQANENIASQQLQGHLGLIAECGACHPTVPSTSNGGPHGLHPIGQRWVSQHQEVARRSSACQSCHGLDYRGTVLALVQATQSNLSGGDGGLRQPAWRGFQIGCYNCHNGPGGEDGFLRNAVPTVANLSASTAAETAVSIPLPGSDTDGDALVWQIISQPAHGTVSLGTNTATYFPAPGFGGSDSFTYAVWDGWTESNLGTVTLTVNFGNCVLTASAAVPSAVLPGSSVSLRASASLAQCGGTFTYDWDFGDGSPHSSDANACHVYTQSGDYAWKLTVQAGDLNQTLNGIVTISPRLGPPITMTLLQAGGVLTITWPADPIGTSLESTSDPTLPSGWQPVTDFPIVSDGSTFTYQAPVTPDPQFFRVRRVP